MENAGLRVVEFLLERFAPLREHRIVVFCARATTAATAGDREAVAYRDWRARSTVLGADPKSSEANAPKLRCCSHCECECTASCATARSDHHHRRVLHRLSVGGGRAGADRADRRPAPGRRDSRRGDIPSACDDSAQPAGEHSTRYTVTFTLQDRPRAPTELRACAADRTADRQPLISSRKTIPSGCRWWRTGTSRTSSSRVHETRTRGAWVTCL